MTRPRKAPLAPFAAALAASFALSLALAGGCTCGDDEDDDEDSDEDVGKGAAGKKPVKRVGPDGEILIEDDPSTAGGATAAVETEPNNARDKAQRIGSSVTGKIDRPREGTADEDWFVVENASDAKMKLKAELTPLPKLDLTLSVFDERGGLLKKVNNAEVGAGETLSNLGVAKGKLFLCVAENRTGDFSGYDEVNTYTLTVNLEALAETEEFEPNEGWGSATDVKPGELKGFFGWRNDVDYYKLVAPIEEGSGLSIEFTGVVGVDARISIYDSIKSLVKTVKASDGGEAKLKNVGLRAGEPYYYIKVAAASGFNTDQTYGLNLTMVKLGKDAESEPNDRVEQATALEPGARVTGFLGKGDVDYYKLELKEPAIVRVEADGVDDVNLRLSLYDASGKKRVALSDVNGKGEGEVITGVALPPGIAYLLVSGGGYNDGVPYSVGVGLTPDDGTTEREPNDKPETATPIMPGGTMKGYLHPRKDVDTYRLDTGMGGRSVRLEIVCTGVAMVNHGIYVFDAPGRELGRATSARAIETERLDITFTPGLYFITVRAESGGASNPRDMYTCSFLEKAP